jgi:predicted nucleic acid-binding Zn ribbon protein
MAAAAKKVRRPRRNRNCLTCGQKFTPIRKDARYCSQKCKVKAWRWRKEREAEQ